MIIGADHAASVCSPLPLSVKARAHDCQGLVAGAEGVNLWIAVCPSPSPCCWSLKKSKLSFPSALPLYWLFATGQRGAGAAGTAFSYSFWCPCGSAAFSDISLSRVPKGGMALMNPREGFEKLTCGVKAR